jgi:acyl-coenzyme A synthetase/AMP-(fatty) acid ligase
MSIDPAILNDIASRVKYVMYAGGDLSSSAGDSVSSRMRLFTACGSTEMGLWPLLAREGTWQADDWHYMHFHPAMNMKMNRVPGADDIFEAVIERNQELPGKDSYIQPIFGLFPGLQKYHTSDLFTPHWSNSNLWKFYGRTDDLQTFSTGEKFHPVTFESLIARHPDVDEVLLVGTGLPQAVLLLRLRVQGSEDIEFVWPIISEANKMCPTYAVITRSTVLQVSKPLPKTAKGTIQRKATIELYREELNGILSKQHRE